MGCVSPLSCSTNRPTSAPLSHVGGRSPSPGTPTRFATISCENSRHWWRPVAMLSMVRCIVVTRPLGLVNPSTAHETHRENRTPWKLPAMLTSLTSSTSSARSNTPISARPPLLAACRTRSRAPCRARKRSPTRCAYCTAASCACVKLSEVRLSECLLHMYRRRCKRRTQRQAQIGRADSPWRGYHLTAMSARRSFSSAAVWTASAGWRQPSSNA